MHCRAAFIVVVHWRVVKRFPKRSLSEISICLAIVRVFWSIGAHGIAAYFQESVTIAVTAGGARPARSKPPLVPGFYLRVNRFEKFPVAIFAVDFPGRVGCIHVLRAIGGRKPTACH